MICFVIVSTLYDTHTQKRLIRYRNRLVKQNNCTLLDLLSAETKKKKKIRSHTACRKRIPYSSCLVIAH